MHGLSNIAKQDRKVRLSRNRRHTQFLFPSVTDPHSSVTDRSKEAAPCAFEAGPAFTSSRETFSSRIAHDSTSPGLELRARKTILSAAVER